MGNTATETFGKSAASSQSFNAAVGQDKKFRTPRTIGPFARAMTSGSKLRQTPGSKDDLSDAGSQTQEAKKYNHPPLHHPVDSNLKKKFDSVKKVEEESWDETYGSRNTDQIEKQLESLANI
mmetsp:Transcript_27975/g.24655  ORF Transcript_27975/g.24655 Transcript_27975/m.24655 type:complete len:122 (-) Transcript_27975:2755-3120(-)